MALVASAFRYLTLTFQDRDNNKGSVEFRVDATVDIADLYAAIPATIVPAVAALSDAVLVGWTIAQRATETAPATAAEASDVERKGVFSFADADGRPVIVSVPSVLNTLVVDGTNVLNTAATAVADFIDLMTDGAVLGALQPISTAGEDVTRFVKAVKTHRKSSKG